MQIPTELATAKLKAALLRPFLAPAILALSPIEKPGLGTVAVDRKWRLYFDPIIFTKWSMVELTGAMIHEVSHLLRDHAGRCLRLSANHNLFNIASDLEINNRLRKEGIALPAEVMYPEKFNLPEGLVAEQYYQLLIKDGGGLSIEQGFGGGSCGSCANGFKEDYEHPEEGVSYSESAKIREQVVKKILAKSNGSGCGNGIADGWLDWAKNQVISKTDWRKELRSLVSNSLSYSSGQVDYTYRKPSRRQGVSGQIILPALYKPIPRLGVVIDTSGSMNKSLIDQVMAEVEKIMKSQEGKDGLFIVACDTRVQWSGKAYKRDQIQLKGGGGTNLRIGISEILDQRIKPSAIIVITDGDTPWPTSMPKGVRLIVALLKKSNRVPSWAKVVNVNVNK